MKNRLFPLYENLFLKEDLQALLDYIDLNYPLDKISTCELLNMVSVSQTTRYIMRGNRVIPHSIKNTLVLWVHRQP